MIPNCSKYMPGCNPLHRAALRPRDYARGMATIHLGDATLHGREAGQGHDAVLLLHAFPLHGGMWAPQLAALGTRFRVLAPDARGMGLSGPSPGVNTMELLAEDALALLRQLGLRSVAVVGLSMGGYVALELWRRAPEVVRGLVLCDTKAVPDTAEQRAARETFAANAMEKGLDWVADDFAPKLLRPEPDPAVARTVRELVAGCTREGVAACQRGMARRQDSVPTLPLITCPTLAIRGVEDQATPNGEMQRIAQNVRGAQLLRIPGAGHLPNLEAPAAFNAAVGTFLAKLF